MKNYEIVLYEDRKAEDLKVKIFKEESKTLEKEILEESFIVSWPLLDQKFSLSVDFTIEIENGLIKNISTKSKISKEAFQRLLLLMHEKFNFTEPNKKKEILLLKNEEFEENSKLEIVNFDKNTERSMKNSVKIIKIQHKSFEEIKNSKKIVIKEKKFEVKHSQFELFENGRFNKVFKCEQEIGKGGFGEVYKVSHKIENTVYAIKKVYLPLKINENIQNHKYFREVMSMTKFNHKNVIR